MKNKPLPPTPEQKKAQLEKEFRVAADLALLNYAYNHPGLGRQILPDRLKKYYDEGTKP